MFWMRLSNWNSSRRERRYRHYVHCAPLAFKAIMTLPQPTAFFALLKGYDGECPCCRRPFADAS
jgi:hypothetical protein